MEYPSEYDVMEFPKQNIELVLCFLTQKDYIPGAASEAEGFKQTSIKETSRRMKD